MTLPIIHTERLTLRPYTMADAPDVQRMVSERDVAATTLSIPHPYPENGAVEWIAKQQQGYEKGESLAFAITLRSTGAVVGTIGLIDIKHDHRHAEMGYLIAKPQWGNRYATEAAAALLQFAFSPEPLNLHRVFAHHMMVNPASGRVMQNVGMTHEGTLRQHIFKWGEPRDVALYGITRDQYDGRSP